MEVMAATDAADAALKARAPVTAAVIAGRDSVPPARTTSNVVALRPAPVPRLRGHDVLRFSRAVLGHYGRWPSEAGLDAAALWCAAATVRQPDGSPAAFTYPRALLTSAEPGSGKSTALELMAMICGTAICADTTPKALKDALGVYNEVVFFDEAHAVFGSRGTSNAKLRAALTAGYRMGPMSRSTSGSKLVSTSLSGWVALAGLDELLTAQGQGLKELLERCIVWRMRQPRHRVPQISRAALRDGANCHLALTTWTAGIVPAFIRAEEQLQDEWAASDSTYEMGESRSAQLWRPLRAAARAADATSPDPGTGETGHEWEQRCVNAEAAMTAGAADIIDIQVEMTEAMARLGG